VGSRSPDEEDAPQVLRESVVHNQHLCCENHEVR
jgi:hypothetical protein